MRIDTQCAVTEFEPGRTMAFSAESKPLDYQGRFDVEPASAGARVELTGTAEMRGFWRILEPLLGGDFRKGVNHELAAIKQHVEALQEHE